ncbi:MULTISPECIES: DUF971 domain-containing protein [unclassified Beijerinckia]|uniref:gamma-butyrobetaine hydroxylase-like domain-containing protein n=1 Tax=unclassified Beijerinckia TaxID=2638183 RepID=UPI000894C168|nr:MULTISPECIES: DUF971 domain-containing protein [unclassified Beijerinckia]MDH7795243.1 DUF971 family protein [Beijerinckia sp. GAS462]SEB93414.1 DUF971 family protein [Beijerinckia sp. 28-YEA-48]
MSAAKDIWPTEIRLSQDRKALTVSFEDGATYTISAELLRVCSPSAEVRGHSEAERKTVGGKRDVMIAKVDPVGNYAVRLTFSDRHDSGIFSWTYLAELGAEADVKFATYQAELAAKGLDRDHPGQK